MTYIIIGVNLLRLALVLFLLLPSLPRSCCDRVFWLLRCILRPHSQRSAAKQRHADQNTSYPWQIPRAHKPTSRSPLNMAPDTHRSMLVFLNSTASAPTPVRDSVTINAAPPSGRFLTSTCPPCCTIIFCTTASPNPVPSAFVV